MERQEDTSQTASERSLIDEVLEARLIASFGTLDPDGTIHLVPMWFRREGRTLLLPTAGNSHKARNARRHPRASVMIHQARSSIEVRGVLVRGPVEIVTGEEARALNRSIHLRYISARGLEREIVAAGLTANDDVTLAVSMEQVTTWDLTGFEMTRVLAEQGDAYALS